MNTLERRFDSPVSTALTGLRSIGPGRVGLVWLGQAGFALGHRDLLMLIDPYLSDSLAHKYRGAYFPHERMVPVPIMPSQIALVDAVLCTHAHTDHMDPWTIRDLLCNNDPTFVVPKAATSTAAERGIAFERTVAVDAGDHVELSCGAAVDVLAAAHEELVTDDEGHHRFLGYVVTVGGVRVYHSGDCVPYDGLAERLSHLDVDVALLPINGRDEHRRSHGVPGNFTLDEAIELCRTARIGHLVGHHFGMFSFNTVDPIAAAGTLARHDWLDATLPELGAVYHLGPSAAASREP